MICPTCDSNQVDENGICLECGSFIFEEIEDEILDYIDQKENEHRNANKE